jgi:hypothetical protein
MDVEYDTWMDQQINACQQSPLGKQAWVRNDEAVHPLRGNGHT